MTRSILGLAIVLLPMLGGCTSTQPLETLSLKELTVRYRRSASAKKRSRLLRHIEKAFKKLERTNSETYLITNLPPDIEDLLIAEVARGALGTQRPRWHRAYSCGGFLYVLGFTCDVKQVSISSRDGKRESWEHADNICDFLLFEGKHVVMYPPDRAQ